MPTPTQYRLFAEYLQSKRFPLWATIPAGLLLGIAGLYIHGNAPTGALRVISILSCWLGAELFLISWALLCIQVWFGNRMPFPFTKRVGEKYPGSYGAWSLFRERASQAFEWWASLCLNFWFISCILVSIPVLLALF